MPLSGKQHFKNLYLWQSIWYKFLFSPNASLLVCTSYDKETILWSKKKYWLNVVVKSFVQTTIAFETEGSLIHHCHRIKFYLQKMMHLNQSDIWLLFQSGCCYFQLSKQDWQQFLIYHSPSDKWSLQIPYHHFYNTFKCYMSWESYSWKYSLALKDILKHFKNSPTSSVKLQKDLHNPKQFKEKYPRGPATSRPQCS